MNYTLEQLRDMKDCELENALLAIVWPGVHGMDFPLHSMMSMIIEHIRERVYRKKISPERLSLFFSLTSEAFVDTLYNARGEYTFHKDIAIAAILACQPKTDLLTEEGIKEALARWVPLTEAN